MAAPLIYVLESCEAGGDPWFGGVYSTARRARAAARKLGHGDLGLIGHLISAYRLDGPDIPESTISVAPPPRPPRAAPKPRSETTMAYGSSETRDTLRSTFQAAASPGKPKGAKPAKGGKAPKAAPEMPKGGMKKGKGKAC
jgi:hypothetical protein